MVNLRHVLLLLFFIIFSISLLSYFLIFTRQQEKQFSRLPSGYKLTYYDQKRSVTGGGFYFETVFEDGKGGRIVVMRLKRVSLCADPTRINKQEIQDYRNIKVVAYDGCSGVYLDENTKKPKILFVKWRATNYSYNLLSADLNIPLGELLKISERFE